MILGIGSDLVDIPRIGRAIERHGERFLTRVFTKGERARAESRGARLASYAKRFAAKEACSKALGCGISDGVFWQDMEVVNEPGGKPRLALSGGAKRRLARLLPEGHEAVLHLTITDEYPMAQAFVVIEALPIPDGAVPNGPTSKEPLL